MKLVCRHLIIVSCHCLHTLTATVLLGLMMIWCAWGQIGHSLVCLCCVLCVEHWCLFRYCVWWVFHKVVSLRLCNMLILFCFTLSLVCGMLTAKCGLENLISLILLLHKKITEISISSFIFWANLLTVPVRSIMLPATRSLCSSVICVHGSVWREPEKCLVHCNTDGKLIYSPGQN